MAQSKGSAIPKKGEKTRKSLRNKTGERPACSQLLIVCEKQSGIPRFCVEVNGSRAAAFQRAATFLALTCSLRGDCPADYDIRVPAHERVRVRITKLASELLRLGRTFSSSVSLSPREREVFRELMRNRANKEIADRLNISLRTVKFHVSALLAKFRVASRWDLIQQAQRMFGTRHPDEVLASLSANPSVSLPAAELAAPRKVVASNERAHRDESRIIPFRRSLRRA